MTFGSILWRVEIRAVFALLVCALLVGALGFADAAMSTYSLLRPADAAWIGSSYTFLIGFVPVVAFGSPIYALLVYRKSASHTGATLIGIFPAIVLFWYDANLAAWCVACGAAVALFTHYWFNKSRDVA